MADVRQGMSARILAIDPTVPEARRFQEMGLTVGTVFRVLKVAPLGDPIEIELRGFRLVMRKGEARFVRIQALEAADV
ncbi:MAG: FeoA domain-containing protein [Fimbriimonadales bacterium]|nr:FeoA domain-containing protein [Fimbriimonadales bacterium]